MTKTVSLCTLTLPVNAHQASARDPVRKGVDAVSRLRRGSFRECGIPEKGRVRVRGPSMAVGGPEGVESLTSQSASGEGTAPKEVAGGTVADSNTVLQEESFPRERAPPPRRRS